MFLTRNAYSLEFIDIQTTPITLGIAVGLIVTTFVISAASGLHKGTARLSSLNAWLLLFLGLFVFIAGPTVFLLSFGTQGLGTYIGNFVELSLFTGALSGDDWPQKWNVFNWAGLPAAIIVLATSLTLWKWLRNPSLLK